MPVHRGIVSNTKTYSKSSDTSRTNTAVLAADTDIVIPVAANEVLLVLYCLVLEAHADADFDFQWTVPAGATLYKHSASIPNTTVATAIADATPEIALTTNTGITYHFTQLMSYIGGAAGGNLTLTWAQHASDANAAKLKSGSYAVVFR